MKDAFGEPPRQAIVLFALTELRLLARHLRHQQHHQERPGRGADGSRRRKACRRPSPVRRARCA